MKGYFIAGTDTNIGKTTIACALLHAFSNAGLKSLGLKPIASGAHETKEGLRNTDGLLLQEWSQIKLPYSKINPFLFKDPVAPHLAAKRECIALSVKNVMEYC